MAQVEIYTTMLCPYCWRAKKLLEERGARVKEVDVMTNGKLRAEMRERAGGRTSVPQIFINGRHVGGCDDLYALDRAGKLEPMLAEAS
jgi:glutaredoxin 3